MSLIKICEVVMLHRYTQMVPHESLAPKWLTSKYEENSEMKAAVSLLNVVNCNIIGIQICIKVILIKKGRII